jgi:hypothetical protein
MKMHTMPQAFAGGGERSGTGPVYRRGANWVAVIDRPVSGRPLSAQGCCSMDAGFLLCWCGFEGIKSSFSFFG